MAKNYWNDAAELTFQLSEEIVGGFDVGFDAGVPEETQKALMEFIYWVEDTYSVPITLWVDFKNRHYLLDPSRKRVDYKFYWVDFDQYPVFEKEADIPVIELPVKQELKKTLATFTEAITHYFAWLCNDYGPGFQPDPTLTEAILQKYLAEHSL